MVIRETESGVFRNSVLLCNFSENLKLSQKVYYSVLKKQWGREVARILGSL